MNANNKNERIRNLARYDDLIFKDEVFAIVGGAMEVLNTLGVGFLESVYQEALEVELAERKIPFVAQHDILVTYKGKALRQTFRADILAYDQIIIELKAVNAIIPAHEGQLLNYLRASSCKLGLLINFGNPKLEWKRLALTKS